MAGEEPIWSLNGDILRRRLSSDVIQGTCMNGDYNTFEEEELPVAGTKTKNRKLIVVTFCISNLLTGMFFSLLAPFFTIEAKKKGATTTVAGVILATYAPVFLLVIPLFGNYLTTIGTKLTFVAGVVVCGGSVIGFGCLDAVPSGTTFIVMCIVIRSVEACGCAAFITASLAILANEFPNNVATIYAVLEMFYGLGFMVGPAVGELLYEAGGFRLPFISSGAAFLAVGGLASLLLPPQTEINQRQRNSFWSFMTILPVWLIGFFSITVLSAFGLCDAALAVHMKTNYHLSTVPFTAVFLVIGGVYGVSSVVCGVIADKKPQLGPALVTVGSLIRSVALILVGPATFLHIPNHPMWLLYVSATLLGLGEGFVVVCAQQLFVVATKHGYPDNMDTKGLVSGIFLFFSSIGLSLGAFVGGWLSDTLGFEWAATILSFTELFALSLWAVYVSTRSCRADITDENHPVLLSNPTD